MVLLSLTLPCLIKNKRKFINSQFHSSSQEIYDALMFSALASITLTTVVYSWRLRTKSLPPQLSRRDVRREKQQ